ncbi:uncharacterized protein LOC119981210 [Tripterygium wilfordii]|uniref:uncharacterized protein LOC119981210 n=1 Tax=Tripterygium wilfordii TaxID=458696 RepID=UPI0018F8019E|nr:uncharacterized protein LOC119981210 [Tripterygium wilfordii]
MTAQVVGSDSWFWKSLLSWRAVISMGLCKLIKSGTNTRVWYDPWIPLQDGTVDNILKIQLLDSSREDRWVWTLSTSRDFSVKIAYHVLNSSAAVPSNSAPLVGNQWNQIWKMDIHARLQLLLWKVAWNILPTRDRLSSVLHMLEDQQSCPLCNGGSESIIHLMIGCLVSFLVWSTSRWHLNSLNFVSRGVVGWVKIILNPQLIGISKEDCHEFCLLAMVSLDSIWRYRNDVIHGMPVRAWRLPRFEASLFLVHWVPPPPISIKVNFDTAMGHEVTSAVAIARSSSGEIVFASVCTSARVDATVGEATALRLGVQRCLELQVHDVEFEGDALIVVNAVARPELVSNWAIENLIEDTRIKLNGIQNGVL